MFDISIESSMVISKSKNWHWYPAIRKLRDESYLLVFSIMPDALPDDITTPHHVMLRSTDKGASWYFHRNLYFPTTVAGDAHVCKQLSNGIILELPNNVHIVKGVLYAPIWKSFDNGLTFSGPYDSQVELPDVETRVAMGRIVANIRFYRSIIELEDGSLLASMEGKFKEDEKYRNFLVESNDGGKSWTYLSTIAYNPDMKGSGFVEPSMVSLKDGSILCVMRTGSGQPLYQAKSFDNGKTWSNLVPMGAKGVDPDLLVLCDGTVACSYGRLYSDLPSMGDAIMFSKDNGATWINHTIIYGGPSTGYTGIEELDSNKILYVYDSLGFGWNQYNTIHSTMINVNVKQT